MTTSGGQYILWDSDNAFLVGRKRGGQKTEQDKAAAAAAKEREKAEKKAAREQARLEKAAQKCAHPLLGSSSGLVDARRINFWMYLKEHGLGSWAI